jgi:hypothetical protein
MRLIDIVADKLANTNLMEMAFQRKEVERKVTDISDTLNEHVIKVMIFPNSRDRDHWLKEIDGYLRSIRGWRIKPKNKIPSYEQYEEWLINKLELYDQLPRFLKEMGHEYPNEKMIIPNRLRYNFLNILKSICRDLSKGNIIFAKEYF